MTKEEMLIKLDNVDNDINKINLNIKKLLDEVDKLKREIFDKDKEKDEILYTYVNENFAYKVGEKCFVNIYGVRVPCVIEKITPNTEKYSYHLVDVSFSFDEDTIKKYDTEYNFYLRDGLIRRFIDLNGVDYFSPNNISISKMEY